jgi:hypothetical protein
MNVIYQKLHSSLTVKVFLVILLVGFVHGIIQILPGLFEVECFSDGCLRCRLSRRQRRLYRNRQQQFWRFFLWVGLCAMSMFVAWGMFRTCRSIALIPASVSRFVVFSQILESVGPFGVIGVFGYIKASVDEESPLSCDQDLAEISRLIDDEAINVWYAPHQTYQPGKRGRKPIPAASKIRVHILFALKQLPSFNETCEQITRNTVYQAFCGVKSISAGVLSQFRASLTFDDLIELMKIFIRKAEEMGFFEGCADLFVQDSTDLESPCSWQVIETITRGKQTINVYHDPTAQLGKRAQKKGKSKFFVGHRKHTLGVVRGTKVIPLLSVVLPANRPDHYVLLPLLHLAGMLGIDVRYLVADLAYIDQKRKQIALKRYGVLVSTDKKVNTTLPEHTDPKTGTPQCFQGENMRWDGFDPASGQHTYICPLDCPHQDCPYATLCPGERTIEADAYPIAFRILPVHTKPVREMLKKRKAVEPMFRRERQHGALDNVTVMGKANVHVLACIADLCDLLKTLAQLQLPMTKTKT